jgi:hypothetical protein
MLPPRPSPAEIRAASSLAKPKMRIIAGKRVVKGTLRFVCKIGLPFGTGELEIADVMVFTSHDESWASLPSKPMLDQDGVHMTAENGKKVYVPFLAWSSKELRDRFSAAVVALVRKEFPDALDDGVSARPRCAPRRPSYSAQRQSVGAPVPDLPADDVTDLYA